MAGDPMDHIIKEAEHNLFQRGSDAVSDRDVILAGFGWFARKIRPESRNGRRREMLGRYGPTAMAGTGTGGLMMAVLEKLTGG
jgi:hypothetical protein